MAVADLQLPFLGLTMLMNAGACALQSPLWPQEEYRRLAARILERAVEIRRFAANESDLFPPLLNPRTGRHWRRGVILQFAFQEARGFQNLGFHFDGRGGDVRGGIRLAAGTVAAFQSPLSAAARATQASPSLLSASSPFSRR